MAVLAYILAGVALSCIIDQASSFECRNPLHIGALWNKKSQGCVDIAGNDGAGDVYFGRCDGKDDQQMIFCGDGTIRNEQANLCLTVYKSYWAQYFAWWVTKWHTIYYIKSQACEMIPGPSDAQLWSLTAGSNFTDSRGKRQTAFKLINKKYKSCVASKRYGVRLSMWQCKDAPLWYFRRRGQIKFVGRMINKKSNQCLTPNNKGLGAVYAGPCKVQKQQLWKWYENGDIVNAKSGQCLDVEGGSGRGKVLVWYCNGGPDNYWKNVTQLCDSDGYCGLYNVKAKGKGCLGVSGYSGVGRAISETCGATADLRFKIEHPGNAIWTTPHVDWQLVGCNMNGAVLQEISNSYEYSEEMTSETSVEISVAYEAGVEVGGASVSKSVGINIGTSLSKTWSSSRQHEKSTMYKCDSYDNGKKFVKGCMWQLNVKTKNRNNHKELSWSPQIVRCSSSQKEPKCPPFTTCLDEECTKCKEIDTLGSVSSFCDNQPLHELCRGG